MEEPIKEEQKRDYTKERHDRCSPVAYMVSKKIAEANLPIGNVTGQEEQYIQIAKEIIVMYLESGIHFTDRHYVSQLILQMVSGALDKVNSSLESNFDKAMEKVWGKDINDVTLKEVDEVLKRPVVGQA